MVLRDGDRRARAAAGRHRARRARPNHQKHPQSEPRGQSARARTCTVVYARVYVCALASVHVYVRAQVYTHSTTCARVGVRVCLRGVCACVHVRVCACACTVPVYVCVCVCVCVCLSVRVPECAWLARMGARGWPGACLRGRPPRVWICDLPDRARDSGVTWHAPLATWRGRRDRISPPLVPDSRRLEAFRHARI